MSAQASAGRESQRPQDQHPHAGDDADALRERLSRLVEASVAINDCSEAEEVLGRVVDAARELTGAAWAVAFLAGDRGELENWASSGLDGDQSAALQEDPTAREGFEFLSGLDGALRIDDLGGYLREQGLPDPAAAMPAGTAAEEVAAVAAPIAHRGQRMGAICAAGKDGGFTAADEDSVRALAAQAALAISNARRRLGEQQARADWDALLNTVPIAVVVFDARTGALRSANPEARRIMSELGTPLDALADLASGGVYQRADGEETNPDELSAIAAAGTVETVRGEEMALEFPNGRKMDAVVDATPIFGADGEIDAVVVTALDMAPLAEMERLRSEFLGMIGHELRAPLSAIKGSAATLSEGRSPLDAAEADQFHRIIEEQADRMIELLADLIDVVQIETGTLPVDPEPCEVSRLVEEARTTFAAGGGAHSIRIEVPADLPLAMADGRRVVQVIVNLLANAARYSHEASPISVSAAESGGAFVAISVTDNGRGLTEDSLPHLFAKFSRPPGPDQSRDLGLGLAICKGIAEAHGGRIWAKSDGPGLGSRFTFTLPTANEADIAAAHSPAAGPAGATRVLAVDDNPRDLKHIRDTLTAAGYDTTVTGDPARIAALAADADPHIVLLDFMLPGADGFEVMRDVLAAHDAPVIFLSAYGQDDLIAKALQMGAADYIVKPFSPTELTARIQAALRDGPQPAPPRPAAGPPVQEPFVLGDLAIDFPSRVVTAAGRTVDLAPVEYGVLVELATHAGTVVARDDLLVTVWGSDSPPDSGRIHTAIKNLRRKLGDDARNPRYIATVPHVGYRMPNPQPAQPPQPPADPS